MLSGDLVSFPLYLGVQVVRSDDGTGCAGGFSWAPQMDRRLQRSTRVFLFLISVIAFGLSRIVGDWCLVFRIFFLTQAYGVFVFAFTTTISTNFFFIWLEYRVDIIRLDWDWVGRCLVLGSRCISRFLS